MILEDITTIHNYEVRYKLNRMKAAIDTLSKLKDADDITPEQFVNEFGYDLLSWLQELQEYWSKD